ncbi:MAG: substrate-binding domain-containing protein [Thermoplasmata archaeon]
MRGEEERTTDEPARDRYEAQASAAGIVLPPRRRLNAWTALAVVAVLVGASIGIGDITGWAIGPRVAGAPGLYGPQQCANAPSYLSVNLSVAASGRADPELPAALTSWGAGFSAWSGGCVHLDAASSAGDGYLPELAGHQVDVVATDTPPNATDRTALAGSTDLLPEAAVPIAVVYNLPDLTSPLRLNGSVLAELYQGSITSWNDPAVAALNPTADLLGAPAVRPVFRSDPGGLNTVFTTFLAESSPIWNGSIGSGPQVSWPSGIAVDGSGAMESELSSTPGAIGYLEATGSVPANTSAAMVRNPSGSFVGPSSDGASAAATARENSSDAKHDDWANVSLNNAPGPASYPITEFLFFALYQDLGKGYSGTLSLTNATWLLTFLWWLAVDAGPYVSTLGFGLLPATFVTLDEQALETVTFNGGSILESGEGGEGGETGEF